MVQQVRDFGGKYAHWGVILALIAMLGNIVAESSHREIKLQEQVASNAESLRVMAANDARVDAELISEIREMSSSIDRLADKIQASNERTARN